ncbi:MAG: hypothetical protein V4708_11250 [Bacteroidota bacterium]
MKMFDKHEFDEIFRSGLSAPDLNEVDEDWELMKARLKGGRNRTAVPIYMVLIWSVAAILLLVFSVDFNSNDSEQYESFVSQSKEKALPLAARSKVENSESIPEKATDEKSKKISQQPETAYSNSLKPINYPARITQDTTSAQSSYNKSIIPGHNALMRPGETVSSGAVGTEPVIAESTSSIKENIPATENGAEAEDIIEANKKSDDRKSRFSLAINFAPDFNGIEQFQSDNVSYTIGAGLIYKINDKFAVEAGAAYGKKSYQTGFSSFRPASYDLFQVKPNVVSSGFDVMDLQLNVDYTVLKKGRSSFGIGAGVSSYLMLDEQYSFTYKNKNARGLSSFHTGYQNNHFLGIANLNLSYKRNLANNVKLAFNPYLKLPLTNLGYGNVRLKSAGMSVGVITNLQKNKK